ncbi:uncharacterized protein DFL_005156 [Arthrobotrys flagrans]|uniref:Uncharacterized protein n=1 Tax=Arthrobotrys flagrans TaxID=97331 RepID=A0A437A6W8_ARTFL|nr:hypothetical protein DFL_005156 [Arthrobotrys flagrans]
MWAIIDRRLWSNGDHKSARNFKLIYALPGAAIGRLRDKDLRVFLDFIPGYNSDLSSKEYYLILDFSYRRDMAKSEYRRGAVIMMASLVDYLYDMYIVNGPPISQKPAEDELDDRQASDYELYSRDNLEIGAKHENSDYLTEYDEEEEITNDGQENYDENQMDEDYDAENYPRNQGGISVGELSYIVPPTPTKKEEVVEFEIVPYVNRFSSAGANYIKTFDMPIHT